MSIEGPKKPEGSDVEREKGKLEKNLDELSENLQELGASEPSRKEKVRAFIRDNYVILSSTLIGLGAGTGAWVHDGTVEDFLFKTGLGILFGATGQYIMNKGKRDAEARRKRMEEDESKDKIDND
jgi:hypothetical protein